MTTGEWRYAKGVVNAVRVGSWVRLTRSALRGGFQRRATSEWGRVVAKRPPVGLLILQDGLRRPKDYYAGLWRVGR